MREAQWIEASRGTTPAREWWESFYGSDEWMAVHAAYWADPRRVVAAVDEIEGHVASGGAPRRILDVPCGLGRLSLELARRGHVVSALDQSPRAIAEARRGAEEAGLEVRFLQGDMRELPWAEAFDCACCWWGSLGYFMDEADNLRTLRAFCGALRDGGVLVLEVWLAEGLLPRFERSGVLSFPGLPDDPDQGRILESCVRVIEDRQWDLERGRVDHDWTYVVDGRASGPHRLSIRIYTYRELEALLRTAGFGAVRMFHAGSKVPFSVRAGGGRTVIVATKGS